MNKLLIFCLVAFMSCRGWAFTRIDLSAYDQHRSDTTGGVINGQNWSNSSSYNFYPDSCDEQLPLVFNMYGINKHYIRIAGVEGALGNYIMFVTTHTPKALRHNSSDNRTIYNTNTSPPL